MNVIKWHMFCSTNGFGDEIAAVAGLFQALLREKIF
jgi:hypothetical protein